MSTRSLLPMSQRSPTGIMHLSSPSSNKSILRSNEKMFFIGAVVFFMMFCFIGMLWLPDMKTVKMYRYLNAEQLGPSLLGIAPPPPQSENDSSDRQAVLPRPAQGREADQERLKQKILEDHLSQADAVIPKPHDLNDNNNKDNNKDINNNNNHINNIPPNNDDEEVEDSRARSSSLKNWQPLPMPEGKDSDPEVVKKQDHVRRMMINSWDNYKRFAWGENELRPVSKAGHSAGIFGTTKLGATIVDGMDTLWIMGLKDRFKEGRNWIDTSFDITAVKSQMSVFETIIRFVGGMLSCYSFTKDEMFLKKAIEVADKMMPAFDTPTGIPFSLVNPSSGASQNYRWASQGYSILAEIGTLYLEFAYLSAVSGNPVYLEKAQNIRKILDEAHKPDGLYPNYISPKNGKFGQAHISLGALGDSFYEYLLKAWIMSGKKDEVSLRMYRNVTEAVDKKLVQTSKSGLKYLADLRYNRVEHKMGHLACFAAGMFSLGANLSIHEQADRNKHFMQLGEDLGNTCHESYARTSTGIGPEVFWFTGELEAQALKNNERYYILRPEVIEGWFYLWRLTKDQKYRDWAWEAVQAIEKYCLAGENGAYSGIDDVNSDKPFKDDVQQSFWLAETLKYLYLIFSSDDLIPLDRWVFNTEAHPLPIKFVNPSFPV